jgi:UDP-MurNAc hydroxylase
MRLRHLTSSTVVVEDDGYEVTSVDDAETDGGHVHISMDDRLLARILRDPEYARFDDAQIGSHIGFQKEPDVYERPLYSAMSFLHV